MSEKRFDYSAFPLGYYHQILREGSPVRRAWHQQKFRRVLDCLAPGPGLSILDIGCFAGSFLSLLDEERFSQQVGVDVLPNQIDFANGHFGSPSRRFLHVSSIGALDLGKAVFDCVTLIEVIEHLDEQEVRIALDKAREVLKEGGRLVITTPNYTSAWPLLEILINKTSSFSYEDQHITKFNYFNVLKKIRRIAPEFLNSFELEFKTTTHFIAPFLARFSMDLAERVSRWRNHRSWRHPFGNLLLLSFIKKPT
jgi:2-polyprenyl-3-methyl-5-hydroxy-6-metoxy-1,4-benzoquinol methylase